MTTEYTPPRAATLHLGGDAWAHPDLEPLVRPLYAEGAGKPIIRRHPDNPRRGDHEAIVESVRVNGVYTPPKVQRSTGYVLAGNHSFDAMLDQGATSMPWVWLDVDDDEARRIMLADNRTAELGGYDQTLLLEQVRAAAAADQLLAGTGYSSDDLAELERAYAAANKQQLNDPDDAPPAPADDYVPISQPGDVWDLGRHRLVVGDSTLADTFTLLLGDEQVACVWTDPPYGVAYKAMRTGTRAIENDQTEATAASVLVPALNLAGKTESTFICCDWRSLPMVLEAMSFAGITPKACIVWDKLTRVQNLDRYAKQHEFMVYAGPFGGQPTQGTDVWQHARVYSDHATPKPIGLVSQALLTATKPGDLILDPFGGSGTTLIACEVEDRTARLIELDPRYADVIARRYQNHTGTIPLRNGKPHDFTTT